MDIGGGANNRYKCHARTKGSFYDLVNPGVSRKSKHSVSIMMDQETNTFPACCIVTLEMVLLAVECFCTTGILSNELTWDNTLRYEPL